MLKREWGLWVQFRTDRLMMTGDGHEEKNGIFSEIFPKKNNMN